MSPSTKLEDNPYIVALSLAEVGRGKKAVAALRTLEEKIKTRMRDFMMAARTMIEGDAEGRTFQIISKSRTQAFSRATVIRRNSFNPSYLRVGPAEYCVSVARTTPSEQRIPSA